MRKAKKDFINIGYWICMKIYFVGTNCCGGANKLASHFGQTSPHKIYLHINSLTIFVASAFSMVRYMASVFHPFDHPFVCPLIFQQLRQP